MTKIRPLADEDEARIQAGIAADPDNPEMTADQMAEQVAEWARSGFVNIVGGCCGSTPAHIRAIAAAVAGQAPRRPRENDHRLRLSGLEAFNA